MKEIQQVHGASHITGGGLVENVPRMLPKHCKAEIMKGSWNCPPIFQYLQELGNISEAEMYRTFNMGIGFVVAIPEHAVNGIETRIPSKFLYCQKHLGRLTLILFFPFYFFC